MTVRVTTLKGPDAGAYYVEGLASYYLDGDEPPGRWLGQVTKALGIGGEILDVDFLAVMAGRHPTSDDVLGRAYGERSVRGFDVTASAPKSVSVLFALGDETVRAAVLDAHDAAVAALAGWIESHAHTRYRLDGQVVIVDAEGIVVAAFRQHVSRSLDPQLHTHLVVPNRVLGPGGRWLALDARTLKCDQRTLSALYHAGLRAELTWRLGVAWQLPVRGIAEIDGVPAEVLAEFSSRSEAVASRIEDKLERFVETFGRDPTPRERWRLEREAVVDSRPAKAHGIDADSLHHDWAERTVALGLDPEAVVAGCLGAAPVEAQLDLFDEEVMAVRALDALVEHQSSWRPAELVRELAAAVPTDTARRAAEVVAWLDELAGTVTARSLTDLSAPIPPGVALRRDGRPVTEAVTARALTTPDVLAQEEAVLDWAERRLAAGGQPAGAVVARAPELDRSQLELAAAVAGGAALVLAGGPAGSGKTTALAPAVAELFSQRRAVFGVAPAAAAAEVLAGARMLTDTLDKLLFEHRRARGPSTDYDLPAGTTLVVDEAATVSTPRMAELAELADRRAWRLVLVGDPAQFSAVGRGGMFAHLVDTYGAVELDRVRRFAHDWEREASLRLRRGDSSVLGLYDAHGRLHSGSGLGMRSAVVDAWWRAHVDGQSVAMMAATNEAMADLSRRAQLRRAHAGEISLTGNRLEIGEQSIYVGDHVATRRNDRALRTDRGQMVRNRDCWMVTAVSSDGSAVLAGRSGAVTLPADYAQAHLELAYASTSHAAQGRTVDRSLLLVDGPTDARGVYVPMSRGRLSNEAFVVLEGNRTAVDVMAEAMSRDWIDRPALTRRDELNPSRRLVTAEACPLGAAALRELLEADHALGRAIDRRGWAADQACRDLDRATERRRQLVRRLDEAAARADNAEKRLTTLDGRLRRLRYRDEIERSVCVANEARRSIERDGAEVSDLTRSIPRLAHHAVEADAARSCPDLEAERQVIRDRLAADRRVRARALAADPPDYLTGQLGPRPHDEPGAARWDEAAAHVDQHRSAFGITGADALLGRAAGWRDTAYNDSHRQIEAFLSDLAPDIDHELVVEPPSLGHGLSL